MHTPAPSLTEAPATIYPKELENADVDAERHTSQLALPEVAHNPTHTLDMINGSSSVKLDHLGPMVVNTDGTLARITNWAEMTEAEKQTTLKMLARRNKTRLDALKAKTET